MDLNLNAEFQDLIFIETAGFSMWSFLKTEERMEDGIFLLIDLL